MAEPEVGWYRDPTHRYNYRYWDGSSWTGYVGSNGDTFTDPDALAPEVASIPPAPETLAPMVGPPSIPSTTPSVEISQRRGGGGLGIVGSALLVLAIAVGLFLAFSNGSEEPAATTVAPAGTEAPAGTDAPTGTTAPDIRPRCAEESWLRNSWLSCNRETIRSSWRG